MPAFDHLIVGAGFAGATCARQLADAGLRVLLIDQLGQAGGNAADVLDAHGVRIHPHGPHIFHTNSARVLQWLSRFTSLAALPAPGAGGSAWPTAAAAHQLPDAEQAVRPATGRGRC